MCNKNEIRRKYGVSMIRRSEVENSLKTNDWGIVQSAVMELEISTLGIVESRKREMENGNYEFQISKDHWGSLFSSEIFELSYVLAGMKKHLSINIDKCLII